MDSAYVKTDITKLTMDARAARKPVPRVLEQTINVLLVIRIIH